MKNLGFLIIALIASLTGCASLPLSDITDIKKLISSTAHPCEAQTRAAFISEGLRADGTFAFVLPVAAQPQADASRALDFTAANGLHHAATFGDFDALTRSAASLLPPTLQKDVVTDAIMRLMIKTSAQSQLASADALQLKVDEKDRNAVAAYAVPKNIGRLKLKAFARMIAQTQLQPTIAPSVDRSVGANAFATYFTAYYHGSFVDRLGQSIKKPQIAGAAASLPVSITIPDADIASAVTVLLEYMVDLFDTTPVLGDTPTVVKDTTKFYPGGTTSEPTALVANRAVYKPLSTCGVTADNASLLADVANAAGDEAATVGGLVSQSFGGVGVSLGVFGKISLGDNQTLGTIVKTAASRLAMRSAFAASYWTLERIGASAGERAAVVYGPSGYLEFPAGNQTD